MVMQSMRKGKFSGPIKFFFMTLLVLATAGLVLTDTGGFFRGGVSATDVAEIDGQPLSIASFDRTVRRTLPRLGITPQEAYELGYLDQILASEIRTILLQRSARDLGIQVGREVVARQVDNLITPLVQEGQDKQAVLDQLLLSQGMSEAEFIAQVSRQAASTLLTDALDYGLENPRGAMLADLALYDLEERSLSYILFPSGEFILQDAPDQQELLTAYEGLKENFLVPERRTITLIAINDETLEATIDVTEEELQALYESDPLSYTEPEKRTLEQAIVEDEATAGSIIDRVKEGATLPEAVEAETGSRESYIAPSAFTEDATLDVLAEQVFAGDVQRGDVIGPIESPLGTHVVVLKDIQPSRQLPFADVKDTIRQDQIELKLIDQKFELSTTLDDMLAAGTALSEIREQLPVTVTRITDLTRFGDTEAENDPLAEFGEDRLNITDTAFELFEGEASPVMEMADGTFLAVQLEAVKPERYPPFEEVKEQVESLWIENERATRNRTFVRGLAEALDAGEATLVNLAAEHGKTVKTMTGMTRGNPADPFDRKAIPLIFGAREGASFTVETSDGLALAVLDTITLPSDFNAESDIPGSLKRRVNTEEDQEALALYLRAKRKDYPVEINRDAIDNLYAPAGGL